MKRALFVSLALVLAAGCGTFPAPNPPLTHPTDLGTGYRWATTTVPNRSSRTFVILTFSGGGTRAAGLSYGVLRQLAATPMPGNGHLIDNVDVISSVSGGSFASMDYAMRGKQMLADFESAFLQKPVQNILFKSAYLNPVNLFKLLFDPHFHRIDVAAQVYDDVLFHNATFDDLLKVQKTNDRPFIIANSTELEIGSRFEWTQDQFDPICSDLTPMHVARAVAASSDFPFLLPPMVLEKYDAGTCKYQPPNWLPNARKDWYLNPLRPRYATELEGYLDPDRRYLHLLDGGIADNIGLRGPLQALISTDTFVQPQNGRTGFTLMPLINQTPPRPIDRVVIVVVNAGAEGQVTIDKTSKEPGLKSIVGGISGTPMDNYSFDSIQLLVMTVGARLDSGVRYYPVIVSFPLIQNAGLRKAVNNIGTSFNALTNEQLNGLKQAADVLIHQDPCFQQFIRDVNGTPTPDTAPTCASALPPTH